MTLRSKPAPRLSVAYVDDVSTRIHWVSMWIEDDMLQLSGPDLIRQVPLSKVAWPDGRQGADQRTAHFSDGGAVHALSIEEWDLWLRRQVPQASPAPAGIDRLRKGWHWATLAAVLLLLVALLAYCSGYGSFA